MDYRVDIWYVDLDSNVNGYTSQPFVMSPTESVRQPSIATSFPSCSLAGFCQTIEPASAEGRISLYFLRLC